MDHFLCYAFLIVSGLADGPVSAFGFEGESFMIISESMQLFDPGMMATRTKVWEAARASRFSSRLRTGLREVVSPNLC